jgi:broad specificity phosphatase PhoE
MAADIIMATMKRPNETAVPLAAAHCCDDDKMIQ